MLKGLSPKEFAKYIYAMKSIKEEEVLDFQGSVEAAEQVREGREIGWKGRQERGGEEGDKREKERQEEDWRLKRRTREFFIDVQT